jgi:hypothetical protein
LSACSAQPQPNAASRGFANGFDEPRDFFNWFMTPDAAANYLADITG